MDTTLKPVSTLPTQDELLYDDGEPLESQRHNMQIWILIETLIPWLEEAEKLGGMARGKKPQFDYRAVVREYSRKR
jgi:hypothetical protein